MSKPKTTPGGGAPVQPSGEITDQERRLREQATLESIVGNLVSRERSKWLDETAEMLKGLEAPERPEILNRQGEQVTRLSSPMDPLYRRLPEEMQQWRTPEADHWNAEWIRGRWLGDHARMQLANAKLEGIFGRADLLEGVPGADGAISTGTGGALIPRPLENVVMIARDRVAKMRRFANLLPMTRQTHTIPTAAAMTAAMAGEGATAAEGNPTIAEVQITAKKGQVRADASKELQHDSAFNLVSIFSTRAGGALGVLEDNQAFRLGDGTGNNITKISGTTYTETTSGILSYTDVLAMFYAVAQQYRDRAIWLVAPNVLQLLSNVRDGQGRPFYQGLMDVPGAITDDPGQVGSILRKPVYEVPFSNGEIWFGDPAAVYTLGTRQGIEFEVSPHFRFDEDMVVFKWTQRFGGINVDTVAAQYATGITSATSV